MYKTQCKVPIIYPLHLCKWLANMMHACPPRVLCSNRCIHLCQKHAQSAISIYTDIQSLSIKREGPQSCNFESALWGHFLNLLQLCKWSPNMLHGCSPLAFVDQIDVYLCVQNMHKMLYRDTLIYQVRAPNARGDNHATLSLH